LKIGYPGSRPPRRSEKPEVIMGSALSDPRNEADHRSVVRPGRPGEIMLSGDFDAEQRDAVQEALTAGEPSDTVVNVVEVRLLDAGTIRLLLQAQQAAVETGHGFRVSGASDLVRHVIEAVGAGRLLSLTDDHPAPTASRGPHRGMELHATRRSEAAATYRRVQEQKDRLHARLQQQVIDGEVRAARRLLISDLRQRLRGDPRALAGSDFLDVADLPAVHSAISTAATVVGAADANDLRLYDAGTATLRVVGRRGSIARVPSDFAAAGPGRPTTFGTAASLGEPVIIEDIVHSPVDGGQAFLDVLRAAGCRAVHSHPLHDGAGQLLGVLSFYYRTTKPRRGNPELVAWCAARALTRHNSNVN
jgi:anti-anti-sigma regulatory factor